MGNVPNVRSECKMSKITPWDPTHRIIIEVHVDKNDLDSLNVATNECNAVYLLNCKERGVDPLESALKYERTKNSKASNVETTFDLEQISKEQKGSKKKRKKGKVHKCPHCAYSTNKILHLTNHIRTHTGEKPFVCSFGECKKAFATKSNLNQHIKRHIGDKRHKCSYCSMRKAFVSSSDLKTHIRSHTGEKPYECIYCTKRFVTSSGCKMHIKTQHQT